MSSICEHCGTTLIPAPARFDGEATFVGYMPHTCKTIKQDERQREVGGTDTDPVCKTDLFKQLKGMIAGLQFDFLGLSEDGKYISSNPATHAIAKYAYHMIQKTIKSLSPESGEQDEEESYQVVLWEEAAMKLFKKYNPGMTLSEGIGNRIYLGFSKDMDFLREYYKITRTT